MGSCTWRIGDLVTLNGLTLHHFIEFGRFGASYITVVEVRPVLYATKM